MDDIIIEKNVFTCENICRMIIINDVCEVTDIYFTFDDKTKVKKLFSTLNCVCDNYNINVCYIITDPNYNLNGINISYSLYTLLYPNYNCILNNGYTPYNDKQNYDLYNKDLVYSVGHEDYNYLKSISNFLYKRNLLDFYFLVKEKIKTIDDHLFLSLNFNMTINEVILNEKQSRDLTLFLKNNKLSIYKYIKII